MIRLGLLCFLFVRMEKNIGVPQKIYQYVIK